MITDEKLQELFFAAKLGSRLIMRRKELKMSKSDFAKKLGVSSYSLSRYEKEETTPSSDIIRTIFEVLELNIEEFLTERHQHILDIRFLLKEERNLVQERIWELEDMIRFYEEKKEKVNTLMEEECSFATEYEDVDIDLSFSGEGDWLSNKLYLTKGVYVFEVAQNDRMTLTLINIARQKYESPIIGQTQTQFKEPVIIQDTGYYLIKIERSKSWSLNIHRENAYSPTQ